MSKSLLDELQDLVAGAGSVRWAVGRRPRAWLGPRVGRRVEPGRVLTCAHVLRGGEVAVTFHEGSRSNGRVAGADPDLDLAVVEVETGDAPAVAWEPERGDALRHGAAVLALADPSGRGLRVTFGLVSATGRSFRGPGGRRVGGSIEHTAPLPRGSSGGPLVDPAGAAGAQRGPPRGRADPRDPRRRGGARAGVRVARGGRPGAHGWAWRSRRPATPAACAAPSACLSATACSSAASSPAARPSAPARARRPDRARGPARGDDGRRAVRRARRPPATRWSSASCAAATSATCT